MNKVLLGLAALPFLAGAASAAQPLTDGQMDTVTAGFDALSTAESQALGKIVATQTSTVSLVAVVTGTASDGTHVPVTATFGETTLTLYKSVSAASSLSSATNALPTASIGLSS
jgi:hypothetical protein